MTPNLTREFLGGEASWRNARVMLDDVHGLWGGRRVVVHGTGDAVIVSVSPAGQHSGPVPVTLSADEVRQLLLAFVDNDFLALAVVPPPMVVPDAVHTEITLVNARGDRHSVGCWSGGATTARFEKIVSALLHIETAVQLAVPTHGT